MKHLNTFERTYRKLATFLAMLLFLCGSLYAVEIQHDISTGSLTIPGSSSNDYVITGTTNENHVVVQKGYKGTITLKDLNISLLSYYDNISPFLVEGEFNRSNYDPITIVNLVLEGDNKLIFYGNEAAALQVDQGAQINISAKNPSDNASGKLFAQASPYSPGSSDYPLGGAAIGAPSSFIHQGESKLYTRDANGTEQQYTDYHDFCYFSDAPDYLYGTAGGNIIINSGTITAWGGHGAGIGGGFQTWYNGIIIVTGGEVEARAGRHAAGLGSGCPTGSGVMNPYADKSAIIALPPCKIKATGAVEGPTSQHPDGRYPEYALAGTKFLTYLNDPAKPVITIRTEDFEKKANIYLDLTETYLDEAKTEGLKDLFGHVHPTFDLTHVWIGKTGDTGDSNEGYMTVNGSFKDPTTFFTDASSTAPETEGRPYMPVSKTTSGPETIILPLFEADIRFTDYASTPLVEGYSTTEAETNAYCLKVEYHDTRSFTDLTFKLQQEALSNFKDLKFLAADSTTLIAAPTSLHPGDVFYIIAPLKDGKMLGVYKDVILIHGEFNSVIMAGYIRRISDQIVVKDDTESNNYIKVTADPATFTENFPTNKTVDLTLNITHAGIPDVPYNPSTVTAKYLITTEPGYDAALVQTPLDQWTNMNIPATDGDNAITTASFAGMEAGVYYIHWYVVSGVVMAHSKDVTDPARTYGGFGKYIINSPRTVTYNGNTNDGGTAAVDGLTYISGDSVTVLGNTGLLTKTDATFIGWSFGVWPVVTTQADEPTDLMNAGHKFEIMSDTTLYAVWAIDTNGPGGGGDSIPDYDQFSVSYDGNGHTSGSAPTDGSLYSSGAQVTAKGHGDLERTGGDTSIVFAGWTPAPVSNILTPETAADTTSAFVRGGGVFTINDSTTLYAVWSTDKNGNEIPDIFEDNYSVTYNGNGSTGGTAPVDGNTYLSGVSVTAKSHGDLVRTGGSDPIIFAGWTPVPVTNVLTPATAADTTTAFVRSGGLFTITGNTTLYAVWSTDKNGNEIPDIFETEYHVNYQGNSSTGGAVPNDATDYLSDMSVTVLGNTGLLTKTDATFIGWSFGVWPVITVKSDEPSDLMNGGDEFTIMSDTTLYAVWAKDTNGPGGGGDSIPDYDQFSVSYDGNGHTSGSAPTDGNLYSNGAQVTAKGHGDLERTGGDTPIVFAGWTPAPVTHVLTPETAADTTSAFVRAGGVFTITGNTTLYAVWSTDKNGNEIPDIFEDNYSVTYNGNGSTGGTAPVDGNTYLSGVSVTAKSHGDLVRTGGSDPIIFAGWTPVPVTNVLTPATAADTTTAFVRSGGLFTITGNTTLYAVWSTDKNGNEIPDIFETEYHVNYQGNSSTGGTVPNDATDYLSDMSVTVLGNTGLLTKTDATFIGWSFGVWPVITVKSDEPSDLMNGGDEFTIMSDTTLYAVWAKDTNGPGGGGDSIPDYDQFSVTYNGNGHTSGSAPTDGSLYSDGAQVTAKGHGDLERTGGSDPIVFAGWTPAPVTHVLTPETVADTTSAFVRGGGVFTINGNTTLYAVWSTDKNGNEIPDIFEDNYSVTYNGNGSTGGTAPVDGNTYLSGMSAKAKSEGTLVRSNSVFIGWSRSGVGIVTTEAEEIAANIIRVDSSFVITSNTTLYAVWGQDTNGPGGGSDSIPDYKQFGVTYDSNGGSGSVIDANIYNSETSVVLKDNDFERISYVFVGWNPTAKILLSESDHNDLLALNTLKQPGETFTITGSTTWYAVWAVDNNGNEIPDYLEKKITFKRGILDSSFSVEDTVAKGSYYRLSEMGFSHPGYMLAGWHTRVMPVITSLGYENYVIGMSKFYAIGDSFKVVNDMTLYAVWVMDSNNDGRPDYLGSIIKPRPKSLRMGVEEDMLSVTGSESIEGVRVWTYANTLNIETPKATRVMIYTMGGALYKQLEVPAGTTNETLKRGIYIVEIDGTRHKVVVK